MSAFLVSMLLFVYLVCIPKWSATQIYGRGIYDGLGRGKAELIDIRKDYNQITTVRDYILVIWLAHAHKDYANRNIKIKPGDEARYHSFRNKLCAVEINFCLDFS